MPALPAGAGRPGQPRSAAAAGRRRADGGADRGDHRRPSPTGRISSTSGTASCPKRRSPMSSGWSRSSSGGAEMWWYDWIKALHVISVIAWMAGMMYLPRLFVYHADAACRLGQVRNVQAHGAAALSRHHHAGDGRHLGVRPRHGVSRTHRLGQRLAVGQGGDGHRPLGHPRLLRAPASATSPTTATCVPRSSSAASTRSRSSSPSSSSSW